MSMRLKRVDEQWLQYVTESGRTFYYNERSGSFQWQHPKTHTGAGGDADADYESASVSTTMSQVQRGASPSDLSSDWQPYTDEQSGAVFWFNNSTQVSQWHSPWEAAAIDSERGEANSDQIARIVVDDGDLGI